MLGLGEAILALAGGGPEPLPIISLAPAPITQEEGNSGTTAYNFTVSLDKVSDEVVTVNYSTNDDTATVADSDYIDNDGVVTFNPGETTKTITVLVNGDTAVESDEEFIVTLDNASNGDINSAANSASGIILNDDVSEINGLTVTVNETTANYLVDSYGGKQDKNPLTTIAEDGSELELEGNGWKKVTLDYNITGNTMLEFEFRSTAEGEIQGIGFDTDDKLSRNRFFKLYGTENWGITNYENYSAEDDWKSYQIPVGKSFTGEIDFLTFGNDHDVKNPTASSEFRNLKLYDIPIHPLAVTVNETTATYSLDSYGGRQDKNPFIAIPTDGSELKLEGNGWKKVALDYNITGNTMLEFEFRSTAEGEIQGIGFDTDDKLSRNRFFKLYGTENWGITNYENYSAEDDWKSYQIPVGKFFTGEMDFLTFGNDHDVKNPTASSEFRNLKLYDIPIHPLAVTVNETTATYSLDSYGGRQDKNSFITIPTDGSELKLEGNGWKKVALDYNITGNTMLEFEFRSTAEGEIQGIGFDNNDKLSRNRFFKLYGTENWGITIYENYSAEDDWKSYQIPVGKFFTGEMDFLTFGNDHDVKNPTASSEFRNLRLYEVDITSELTVSNDELVEIVGSSENDFITGTKAGDIIIGLEAEDTLTGGLGSDQFVYNRLADAGDVITDFEVGNDQIVLTELFANLDYHGSDAMVDGYIQLVQENSGVGVNIDPDGLNGQESFIPLTFVEGVSLAELNDSTNFLY